MWDKQIYDFGTLAPNKKVVAEFNYSGDKDIALIEPACGCTVPEFTKDKVKLTYTTARIPQHLKKNGEMKISKTANVIFDDGSKEVISIVGLIKQ